MYCLASTDNLTTEALRKINNVYRRQLSERKEKEKYYWYWCKM